MCTRWPAGPRNASEDERDTAVTPCRAPLSGRAAADRPNCAGYSYMPMPASPVIIIERSLVRALFPATGLQNNAAQGMLFDHAQFMYSGKMNGSCSITWIFQNVWAMTRTQ